METIKELYASSGTLKAVVTKVDNAVLRINIFRWEYDEWADHGVWIRVGPFSLVDDIETATKVAKENLVAASGHDLGRYDDDPHWKPPPSSGDKS